MHHRRRVAVGVRAVTGFSACSGDAATPSGHHKYRVPSEPATKPDRLVIRIWSGDQQKVYADTAAKKFTAATGIPIVWDTTDEAVSYAKLNQEISSGQRPSADASFNAQQRAYTNAARGWTIPIDPQLAPNLAKVTAETAAPPDNKGDPGSTSTRTRSRCRSSSAPTRSIPNRYRHGTTCSSPNCPEHRRRHDLLEHRVRVRPINGRGPRQEPARRAWTPSGPSIGGLKPNLAQLGSNADVVTALTNGSVKVAISNTGSGIAAQNAGAPVEIVAPNDGIYVVGDSYYIHKGIPAANAYYAQVFANYLLDPAVQSVVADKLGPRPGEPRRDRADIHERQQVGVSALGRRPEGRQGDRGANSAHGEE